jgi:endonuclease III
VKLEKIEDELKMQSKSPSRMSPAKPKVLESLGTSPFPDFVHPTHECQAVNKALTRAHGECKRPKTLNASRLYVNCREVPSVLDALIHTIILQNMNNKDSSTAKKSLDKTFGVGDYDAV